MLHHCDLTHKERQLYVEVSYSMLTNISSSTTTFPRKFHDYSPNYHHIISNGSGQADPVRRFPSRDRSISSSWGELSAVPLPLWSTDERVCQGV
ncbi:hypothetical protein LSAT2_009702 [Lamellibrachia satsuma]|nr:hypothetical protein LSAT2_009702 [Lamellibrachia satsuma]